MLRTVRNASLAGLGALAALGLALIVTAPRWASPGADSAPGRRYITGIFEDPSARNPWARHGPNGTVWNSYVSAGALPALFGYTTERLDWVPRLAQDVPSPLEYDEQQRLWRSTVRLKRNILWSDGTPVTAHDVAFTFDAIMRFGAIKLGGNFPSYAPDDVLARVRALDDDNVEFLMHRRDARYRFGVLTSPIFQKGFWEPHVKAALMAEDPLRAIFDVDVTGEPVAGAFLRGTWERGSFIDRPVNRRFTPDTATEELFANGAVRLTDGKGETWTGYGQPDGAPVLRVSNVPRVDAVHYKVYGSQAAGVLALQAGEVSFLYNSLGLEKGFEDQLKSQPGITIVRNPSNSVRFMGFNFRREPMRRPAFRQAVATLIDRQFITERVLQGVATPRVSVVPVDNTFWHNPDVIEYGKGLTRADRIRDAVRILEGEGFSWTRKPQLGADGTLIQPGQGLRMPDGQPVRPLNLLSPTESYDPLRATFAAWVERWLNEVGIPVRKNYLAFNVLISRANDQQDFDMWISGFTLTLYPAYLNTMFHSRYTSPRARNTAGYVSREYDALVDEFLGEADDMNRARTLALRLQEILARDLPWIPLFETPIVEAYRSDQVTFPTTRGLNGLQGARNNEMPGLIESVDLAQ
ncbi:MAG: ABC transporter substrate-binding protein [Vicinamibacterales bacterium]